eukprot:m.26821 g.26821  ORF g.26821 m.26821 type:complete len:56 (+) comp29537_c0_seq1:3-170(+)
MNESPSTQDASDKDSRDDDAKEVNSRESCSAQVVKARPSRRPADVPPLRFRDIVS